jgi:ubiquinone/menaquinone biosynthesis C-methylase UbiE
MVVGNTSKTERQGSRHYDSNYGNFHTELYARVRHEAFGEDIGQNSWLTAGEQDRFFQLLDLSSGRKLLDIACGAGGPALRLASKIGCSVVGVDVHPFAIEAAAALAAELGLTQSAEFRVVDAALPLPFADSSVDAITCIDAINHLPDRKRILLEWARVLKPSGRLLFTDPTVVTGPVTNEEIAVRTSAGFYLLTPPGYNEQLLRQCGFRILTSEDATQGMAESANSRKTARVAHELELRAVEGDTPYDRQQTFLAMVAGLAEEQRLSRFVYAAERQPPGNEL